MRQVFFRFSENFQYLELLPILGATKILHDNSDFDNHFGFLKSSYDSFNLQSPIYMQKIDIKHQQMSCLLQKSIFKLVL